MITLDNYLNKPIFLKGIREIRIEKKENNYVIMLNENYYAIIENSTKKGIYYRTICFKKIFIPYTDLKENYLI